MVDGEKLYREMMAKRREERLTGYARKGRRSAFEQGYEWGGVVKAFDGVKNIPQYIRDAFKKPKTEKARKMFDLGALFGKKY